MFVFQCSVLNVQPWRDSGSIRDASPAARQRTGSQRVSLLHTVFLFPDESPARQKEPTTLPPTIPSTVRTVSVLQVCGRVARFFLLVQFVRCCYAHRRCYARCFSRSELLPLFVTPLYSQNNFRKKNRRACHIKSICIYFRFITSL